MSLPELLGIGLAALVLLSCENPAAPPVSAPVLGVSSSSLSLSSGATLVLRGAVVGTPSSTAATLSNTGNAVLTVGSFALSGSGASLFSVSPPTATVAAGSSATFTVTFSPTASGTFTASLAINNNSGLSPFVLNLQAKATLTAVPALTLLDGTTVLEAGSTLSFPKTTLSGSGATKTLTLSNTGTAALTFASAALSGANASDFGLGTLPGSIAAGSSAGFSVTFAPTAAGTRSAVLTFTSDDGNTAGSTYAVNLSGEGSTGAPNPADAPDGWASVGAPANPGGYGATTAHTYTVANRAELLNALRLGGSSTSDTAKIIYVSGTIDLCVDSSDASLSGWDFLNQAGYGSTYTTYAAFRDAYAAASTTSGVGSSLQTVRAAAFAKQKAVVSINVGSNTSILGIGSDAVIKNGALTISGKTNVVIRNVALLDAYDYFPSWDATDGSTGNFNSEYDNLTITSGSTYVWVDHCYLGDGARPDSSLPSYTIGSANKKYVAHDGLLDITNGANYVTVSYNYFYDHDKTSLIGSSDSATGDSGKLKSTFHHNYYNGTKQRLPRVRFGQIHVYNNYYVNVSSYAIGVGDNARIYSENNYFNGLSKPVDNSFDDSSNPGYCYDTGSVGMSGANDSAAQVGWTPSANYSYTADSAEDAKTKVLANYGVGRF